MSDPLKHKSIAQLGPDALKSTFDIESVRNRLHKRGKMKLADLLLDQTFVAGIGNKYKSKYCFYESFGRLELQIIYLSRKNNNY